MPGLESLQRGHGEGAASILEKVNELKESHGRHDFTLPFCYAVCSELSVQTLIDRTLITFRVSPEDAEQDTCVTSNSLGAPPSASAYLTVQCG